MSPATTRASRRRHAPRLRTACGRCWPGRRAPQARRWRGHDGRAAAISGRQLVLAWGHILCRWNGGSDVSPDCWTDERTSTRFLLFLLESLRKSARSLSHAPKAPAGQEQYYGPHSIPKHTDKLVYMRNPREGGKPQYQKDFFDNASGVIRTIAPEWAGDDEDFVVQLKVYDSDNGDYCNEHVDSHDTSTQYMVCFGSYKGGELEVKINGEWKPVDLRDRDLLKAPSSDWCTRAAR